MKNKRKRNIDFKISYILMGIYFFISYSILSMELREILNDNFNIEILIRYFTSVLIYSSIYSIVLVTIINSYTKNSWKNKVQINLEFISNCIYIDESGRSRLGNLLIENNTLTYISSNYKSFTIKWKKNKFEDIIINESKLKIKYFLLFPNKTKLLQFLYDGNTLKFLIPKNNDILNILSK